MLLVASVAALVNPARRFPTIHRNSAPTADAVSISTARQRGGFTAVRAVLGGVNAGAVTLNANDWTALGKAKRLAVLCRLSVVHLTVISCVSGGLLAAAAAPAKATHYDLRSGP